MQEDSATTSIVTSPFFSRSNSSSIFVYVWISHGSSFCLLKNSERSLAYSSSRSNRTITASFCSINKLLLCITAHCKKRDRPYRFRLPDVLSPLQNTPSSVHSGQHPTHIHPDNTICPTDYVPGTFCKVQKLLRIAARKIENRELFHRKNILHRHPGVSRHRLPWHQYKKTDRMPLSSVKSFTAFAFRVIGVLPETLSVILTASSPLYQVKSLYPSTGTA